MPDPRQALDRFDTLLAAARGGDRAALGQLLEVARTYLLGIANRELDTAIQAKVGSSDVVQEAFAEAYRVFERFEGQSTAELLGWMRSILLNTMANTDRKYRQTEKRAVSREVSLDRGATDSTPGFDPSAAQDTPSEALVRDEQKTAIMAALQRLPDHYRQVLVWRHWDNLTFEEIGKRLDKTAEAARMLWARAAARLRTEMGGVE